MSADPLSVHALGGDLNVYAYVSGQALKSVDPLGLCSNSEPCGPDQGAQGQGSASSDEIAAANSTFMQWNDEHVAAQKQFAAELKAGLESRDLQMSVFEAQQAGQQAAIDATPHRAAAAARQKAAEGLATMTVTTPYAPVVVTLQALTGNNDGAVLANHIGGIGTVTMSPYGGGYKLSSDAIRPPRVDTTSAPARGPPATRELAQKVAAVENRSWTRTVNVLETKQGPTLVSAGGRDLTPQQKKVAAQLGLTVTRDMPGAHAEITGILGASGLGLTPTRGATTNIICSGPGGCGPFIQSLGGTLTSKFTYEF